MAFDSAVDHEGGYDYDFVESPPDRLMCKICQSPCREAQLTVCCGHVFCKFCLTKLRSSATVSKACPTCRKEPFDAYDQLEADREIKVLKVYCPNKKDGCGWTGELANIIKHNPLQQRCERCDKCDDIIHYSDVHLPTNCPCYCPHCDTTADREVINSEHKEKCNKFPQRCPNNCGQDIPWDSMDDHKKVCPFEMVQCEFQCGARIVRNEVEKHNEEKSSEHIQLARTVRESKTTQTAQLRSVEKSVPIWPHFTMTTVALVIVIAIQTAILLPSYYTTTDLSLSQARLLIKELQNNKTQNDEELTRAKSHIVKLQNDIKDLKVKKIEHLEKLTQSESLVKQLQNDIKDLKVKETKHLQNLTQSESLVKQLQNDIKDLKVKETKHLQKLTQSESLVKQLQNDIKDLKVKHSEELTKPANCKSEELTPTESKFNHLLSLLKSAYSYISKHDDESLWPLKLFISDEISDQVAPDAILKMSDFAKKKENKELWYSKTFFAFQQGYQMCLSVYADGTDDGEGTHVSVYLHLMKGPHDDELEQSGYWPLNGIFTIELLNQLNNTDHKMTFSPSTPNNNINRVVNDSNAVWGYPRFISHNFLLHHSKIKYLRNDTLYFRVSYQKLHWYWHWGMIVVLFILIVILSLLLEKLYNYIYL